MIDLNIVRDRAVIELATHVSVVGQSNECRERIHVAKCTLCTFSYLVDSLLLISKLHIFIKLVPMSCYTKGRAPLLTYMAVIKGKSVDFFKKANTYFSETRLTQSNPTFAFTC